MSFPPGPQEPPNSGHVNGDATLFVDLDAICANYDLFSALTRGAETAAVVKANAYGTGIKRVGPALARHGARTFFVAQLAEAAELRAALEAASCQARIFVFNAGWAGDESAFGKSRLTPVLNTVEDIDRWSAYGRANGIQDCALHIDTGINRLGLDHTGVTVLADNPSRLDGLSVKLVMSHLACADTPDHALNRRQLERFKTWRQALPAAPASLANSAGTMLGTDYHFDLVRPGIGLYGSNPRPSLKNTLKPTVRLTAPVLQIKSVSAGESVGYGATFTAERPLRIAIVSLGYADGIHRILSNVGSVQIAGKPAPIVGRISMDLIALDVTDISLQGTPDLAQIEFIGSETHVDELAEAAGTISYEFLSGLGRRFSRIYLEKEDLNRP